MGNAVMTTVNQNKQKATVELTAAELGHIDALVKKGLYKSREDFLQQIVDTPITDNDTHADWGGAPVYLTLRMH
jgi:metal-responsive CopG/Arc/MetJ family transcriptional regulator